MAKRFGRATRRFFRILREKWWIALWFVIWELAKDRVANWGNSQIDEKSGWFMEFLASTANSLASAPLGWTIAAAIFVLVGLFVHSYFFDSSAAPVTGPALPISSQPKQPQLGSGATPSIANRVIGRATPLLTFDQWDEVDTFTVAQAACLWCEVKPEVFLYSSLRDQNPNIAAVNQMLVSEMKAGRLAFDSSDNAFASIGTYDKSYVERSDLLVLAERRQQKPKFLYPEER